MRNKILLYLFIFTLLSALFIYMNDKRILDDREQKIETMEHEEDVLKSEKDSLVKLSQNAGEDYFSLKNNEEAITYFENKGIDTQDLIARIEDAMISKNIAGQDNALVPQAGMEGDMRINKIKVLNHKWIIADFTDGTYWGEVFLSYEVGDDGTINFYPEKSFLYPLD